LPSILVAAKDFQLRHTFATRFMLMGINSYLARKLMRSLPKVLFGNEREYGRGVAAKSCLSKGDRKRSREIELKSTYVRLVGKTPKTERVATPVGVTLVRSSRSNANLN
jgi:hypothetical protein